jgi:hypothetical protein
MTINEWNLDCYAMFSQQKFGKKPGTGKLAMEKKIEMNFEA